MSEITLFAGHYLPDMLKAQKEEARKAALDIGSVSTNLTEDEIIKKLVFKYKVEPPTIYEDKIERGLEDDCVDLSRTHYAALLGIESTATPVKIAVYRVPFSGEGVFFQFRPSTYSMAPPRAEVEGQMLTLRYPVIHQPAEDIKKMFERDLEQIKESLGRQHMDVRPFLDELESFIKATLEQAKVSKNRDEDYLNGL